jgi:hypothetical protein
MTLFLILGAAMFLPDKEAVKYAPSKCYEQINGQMEKAVPRLMLATALKI